MSRLAGKKGMTLVELIAVMAISVMILGAACMALYAGSKTFREGAAGYANHGSAKLLETNFQSVLPTALSVAVASDKLKRSDPSSPDVYNFYFDSNKNFIMEKNGSIQMTFSGIDSVKLSTQDAGVNKKLDYEIHAQEGGQSYVLSGGIVLNNDRSSDIAPEELSAGGGALTYLNIKKQHS